VPSLSLTRWKHCRRDRTCGLHKGGQNAPDIRCYFIRIRRCRSLQPDLVSGCDSLEREAGYLFRTICSRLQDPNRCHACSRDARGLSIDMTFVFAAVAAVMVALALRLAPRRRSSGNGKVTRRRAF